jgi:hypothetical protein
VTVSADADLRVVVSVAARLAAGSTEAAASMAAEAVGSMAAEVVGSTAAEVVGSTEAEADSTVAAVDTGDSWDEAESLTPTSEH